MDPHWAFLAQAASTIRRSRTSLARKPFDTQRYSVDFADGLLRSILEVLAQALHDEGLLDLEEAFIDGSFAPAKREAPPSARPSAGRDRRSWPS